MPDALLLPLDDPDGRAAYERLWATSPQRTVFAHPDAVAATAGAFGYVPRLAAVPGGDGFAAAVPVFEKRRGPFRAAALPPLMPVASPLLAGPLAAHEVHARRSPLDRLLGGLAGRYDQASLLLHPSLGDVRPLLWSGWAVTPRYTGGVDLADADDPLAGWSAAARRAARQAAAGYRVEEDTRHTEAAVALMAASYRRHGEALGLDAAAVRRLAHAFVGAGLARLFAAIPTNGREPEAALVAACDGQTAHYWIAGSRPGPATTVLLAEALGRLRAAGVGYFDFVGANTPSIAEFKRRCGARLTLHFQARYLGHPALRLLHRLHGH